MRHRDGVVGFVGGVVGPSFAATGPCPGRLLEAPTPIKRNGAIIAEVGLYWDSATGKNCVRVNHRGSTVGVKLPTGATITTSTKSSTGEIYSSNQDYGTYAYYAGPVSLPGRGLCVAAYGSIKVGTVWYTADTGAPKYCGG